jgi:hypothetical protein
MLAEGADVPDGVEGNFKLRSFLQCPSKQPRKFHRSISRSRLHFDTPRVNLWRWWDRVNGLAGLRYVWPLLFPHVPSRESSGPGIPLVDRSFLITVIGWVPISGPLTRLWDELAGYASPPASTSNLLNLPKGKYESLETKIGCSRRSKERVRSKARERGTTGTAGGFRTGENPRNERETSESSTFGRAVGHLQTHNACSGTRNP